MHARDFIRTTRQRTPETLFAIAVGREAGRRPGLRAPSDVGARLGGDRLLARRAVLGPRITTEALTAVTRHAIEVHGLTRVYALPFAWNVPSCRVLEKAGFVLEARLRRSAIKDGLVTDQMQ